MNAKQTQSAAPAAAPALDAYLDEKRVVVDLEVSSRKRLFEAMAALLSGAAAAANDADAPSLDGVLHTLTKREKLGCTGIGDGVALPHGRIDGLRQPLIAIARLKDGIDYEAPDGKPVWLAVCLLAPGEAANEHLQLLAALAERFKMPGFVERVKQSRTSAELTSQFKRPAE